MSKIWVIIKWEISKLFGNWRKAIAVFLLPSILMMVALNLFPALMNYMSTGYFSQRPALAVNAPDSFRDFVEENKRSLSFEFSFYDKSTLSKSEERDIVKHGQIIVKFDNDFDRKIRNFDEQALTTDYKDLKRNIEIELGYDAQNLTARAKAETIEATVLEDYMDYLLENLGGDYTNVGRDRFVTNEFNPVTFIVRNRSNANDSASRLIPGIMGILLYYCVYSLACDMFASERDRGFFNKLLMTPLSPGQLFAGKTIAITAISSASAYVTFVLMFFVSWLNRSNDAMSLLPFGMILGGKELITFILLIPPTAFAMAGLCIKIIFSLEKLPDILMNLQLPIMFFLILFFVMMMRTASPFLIEYMIPIYTGICGITDVFRANIRIPYILISIVLNVLTGYRLIYKTYKKLED